MAGRGPCDGQRRANASAADYRRIKLCNIVDEFTREAFAMRVARRCDADDVVNIIEQLAAARLSICP